MNRVYLSVIALLIAGALLLGWRLNSLTEQNAVLAEAYRSSVQALNRAQERAKADRKVLVARQAKIATQGRKLAEQEQSLQNALQANKSWSDTDVPDDVQKALSGSHSGLPDRL